MCTIKHKLCTRDYKTSTNAPRYLQFSIQHIECQLAPLHVEHFRAFHDSHDKCPNQISLEREIVDHGIQSSSYTLCLYLERIGP